jgi:hypothetical protein
MAEMDWVKDAEREAYIRGAKDALNMVIDSCPPKWNKFGRRCRYEDENGCASCWLKCIKRGEWPEAADG